MTKRMNFCSHRCLGLSIQTAGCASYFLPFAMGERKSAPFVDCQSRLCLMLSSTDCCGCGGRVGAARRRPRPLPPPPGALPLRGDPRPRPPEGEPGPEVAGSCTCVTSISWKPSTSPTTEPARVGLQMMINNEHGASSRRMEVKKRYTCSTTTKRGEQCT